MWTARINKLDKVIKPQQELLWCFDAHLALDNKPNFGLNQFQQRSLTKYLIVQSSSNDNDLINFSAIKPRAIESMVKQ